MKSRVARLLSIGIALTAAVTVYAQDKTMTADVPFSFYMGSNLMPQGAYRVNKISHGAVVWLKSAESKASGTATTHRAESIKMDEPAKLVFHRYGDSYFLAEVWTGDGSVGQAIARSSHEKELAKGGAPMRLAMIQVYLNR